MKRLACVLMLVAAGCGEAPTPLEYNDLPPVVVNPAPPSSCDAFAPLSVTLRDLPGDFLQSDGGGAYAESDPDVEAHINAPTGNLSIWTTVSPTRHLVATKPAGGTVNIDRVYTNTHSVTCGLRLSTLPTNSTAVLEAEERAGPAGGTVSVIRYGKSCASGTPAGASVTITKLLDGSVVIAGSSGVYCTKNKNKFVHSGMVGPFEMTLDPQ